ncbi:MAG: hypothetical protein ACHQRK_07015 [Gemmatimonadales bacterium]
MIRLPRAVPILALLVLAPLRLLPAQRPATDTTAKPSGDEPIFNPVVHAMIFGDASYVATDRAIPSGFVLGQAVGHVVASLTDRLAYFGEVTLSSQPTGYTIEMERSILRYDVTDALKISGGRYHTPIGYWNTAFHHGTWLQTSVSRPEMVKYGSQFIPTHFVGAMAEGNLPAGDLGLGYMLGVGNGRGATISRAGDAGDVNSSRAVTAAISASPAALFGLQFGGGYYKDRVTPTAGATADEGIASAYVTWQHESPEFIAEYADVRHTPAAGGTTADNHAFYIQLGYRLPGAASRFKPYARTEKLVTSPTDVIFAPLALGYTGTLGGVRYDFAPFAALKAEFRREQFQGHDWSKSFYLNLSFTIPNVVGGESNPMSHS